MNYRIGISMRVTNALQYDEVRDSIAHDWSNYMQNVFQNSKWMFIPNLGKKTVDYFKDWDLNVLFLTGGDDIGKFEIRDESEIELVKYAVANSIPIVAICRGMQLIHYLYKGKIKKGNNEFIENHRTNRHVVSIENLTYEVNSYHVNYLEENTLNDTFKVFSRCQLDNSIEGFNNNKILAMMWHPERETQPAKWNEDLIKNFLKTNEI